MSQQCEIQWIDCNGVPTPDTNVAVASVTFIKDGRCFNICADHLTTLWLNKCHHDSNCTHYSTFPSAWTYTAYDEGTIK